MAAAPRMPLMQNAPFEYGCSGLGAIPVTRPSRTVSSEPQQTEHSQHVLGYTAGASSRAVVWTSVSVIFAGLACRVVGDLDQVAVRVAAVDRGHRPERTGALHRSGRYRDPAAAQVLGDDLGVASRDEAQVERARRISGAGLPVGG